MPIELTGIIQGTAPRRGKGPGIIKVTNPSTGEVLELSTFDGNLVRLVAGNHGKPVVVTYDEKPSKKDPTIIYKNLVDLTIQGAQEGPQEGLGDTIEAETGIPVPPDSQVPAKRAPARVLDISPMSELEQGFALAIRQRELLKSYVQSQFKEGTHYFNGKLFGQGANAKDVLAQPGAQLILYAHGLRSIPKIISGPMEAPKDPYQPYTIVIECEIFNKHEEKVGSGLGSASSLIWSGKYQSYVPRAVDSDKTHNTTVKMAVKRAMVAAAIQTTAASEFFSQDIEEGGFSDEEKDQAFGGTKKTGGGFKR